MTDKYDPLNDAELDSLFEAARAVPEADAEPSADLLAAIMADADRLQPSSPASPRRNLWRDVTEALGGWMGMGGLVAASVTGLVIGVATPDLVGDLTAYLNGSDTLVDTGSDFAALMEEG